MSSGFAQNSQPQFVTDAAVPDQVETSVSGEVQTLAAGGDSALTSSEGAWISLGGLAGRSTEFQREPDVERAFQIWLKNYYSFRARPTRQTVRSCLACQISELDDKISDQVNAILHHPDFQRLEAGWRGIQMLTEQAYDSVTTSYDADPPEFEVRVLTVSKASLIKDFDRALEFDQNQLFKLVYDSGFGIAGGHPFGALIGDFEFTNHPEDVALLEKISGVAAAAFCPFIASASPELFEVNTFEELLRPKVDRGVVPRSGNSRSHLKDPFQSPAYIGWRALRDSPDARFVGLTMPRVLMRLPYENDGTRHDGFRFTEQVGAADRSEYLWGNAAFAFGTVLLRAFGDCRWFADIRGVERGLVGGGLVTDLPVHSFNTDQMGVALKSSVEVTVDDLLQDELSYYGLIPVCPCKDTQYSVFYSNASVNNPASLDTEEAETNARMSAMLQYTLCASRFAHYLKVLARDKIGGFQTEADLEQQLQNWIGPYIAPSKTSDAKTKAKFPLRGAKIEVKEVKPGGYKLTMHLQPHYQLDGLVSQLRFKMQGRFA